MLMERIHQYTAMASIDVDLSVPQELIDTIIDHLHDDPPSLLACGLATKKWLPSSRYHLFSRVALHEGNVHQENLKLLILS